jgi:hypothetical protein
MSLETAVAIQIPFALSLSKRLGICMLATQWVTMKKPAHASTGLSTNGFPNCQFIFLDKRNQKLTFNL